MTELKIAEAPKEILRVTPDGRIHTAGGNFASWAEYVQYVAELEAENTKLLDTYNTNIYAANKRIVGFEAALEDIAKGNANVPDAILESGRPALTSYMWKYSQERAREALDADSSL